MHPKHDNIVAHGNRNPLYSASILIEKEQYYQPILN